MPLDPDSLINRTVAGYTVEELMGSGTFAWVFRARGPDGKPVAIKVLRPRYAGDPEFESRFRNEFQVASELSHDHVIRILTVGRENNLTFFAMDHCPDSLAQRVSRDGPLAETELVSVGYQMAAALTFAHTAGFVHRDIKPDNILFTETGRAVLADFGIAKAVSGFAKATGQNMTIGTPHYVSPEQAQGRPLDGRTDLYSLGVTLYNASTGTLPFRSTDWFELARMHVEEAPERPRILRAELSERFERIILKLMAKHPDDRYQTAEHLASDLRQIQRDSRATESFGGSISRTSIPIFEQKRSKWPTRVAAALVVIAVAVVVVLLGSR
jgi:serine/threonine protein kinase